MNIIARKLSELVDPDLDDLPDTDGEPLESGWHRIAMNALIDSLRHHWADRDDFYTGGNMFIYYSEVDKQDIQFRGPDFFFVNHVPRMPERRYWRVDREGGRYPDVVIELMSPRTKKVDLTIKKDIYEKIFRTPEYFCYDPKTKKLLGWRLKKGEYEPITAKKDGRMWSKRLEFWLGTWQGESSETPDTYLRFFRKDGELVYSQGEAQRLRADAERQRADAERQRADDLEEELKQLRARSKKDK